MTRYALIGTAIVTDETLNAAATLGAAVVRAVPSSSSMNIAPATSRAVGRGNAPGLGMLLVADGSRRRAVIRMGWSIARAIRVLHQRPVSGVVRGLG